MVKINKLNLGIGVLIAVIAFIGLYFFLIFAPKELPGNNNTLENVELNVPGGSDITVISAYWGTSDKPANLTDVCSNETKNLEEGFEFTIEAETRIIAPNYNECAVYNNGHKISTTVNEMHSNYMDLQAMAETDRKNLVMICCSLGERLDCSNVTTLLQCE